MTAVIDFYSVVINIWSSDNILVEWVVIMNAECNEAWMRTTNRHLPKDAMRWISNNRTNINECSMNGTTTRCNDYLETRYKRKHYKQIMLWIWYCKLHIIWLGVGRPSRMLAIRIGIVKISIMRRRNKSKIKSARHGKLCQRSAFLFKVFIGLVWFGLVESLNASSAVFEDKSSVGQQQIVSESRTANNPNPWYF